MSRKPSSVNPQLTAQNRSKALQSMVYPASPMLVLGIYLIIYNDNKIKFSIIYGLSLVEVSWTQDPSPSWRMSGSGYESLTLNPEPTLGDWPPCGVSRVEEQRSSSLRPAKFVFRTFWMICLCPYEYGLAHPESQAQENYFNIETPLHGYFNKQGPAPRGSGLSFFCFCFF